jgi:serine O-acetyltransferase
MSPDFIDYLFEKSKECNACSRPEEVERFVHGLIQILFPDFDKPEFDSVEAIAERIDLLKTLLKQIISGNVQEGTESEEVINDFFALVPVLYEQIKQDVTAMFDGDPAAKSTTEIIRTYPGFFAIASYRIAHSLLGLGVALIPRIITERAHSKTGIDIHPGAKIGSHFCIDHGTGIVIGETTIIGNHVKIYQGVTLGGLSVDKADAEKKRHPTIQDHVVIYAGATILGGNTIVGEHSVIGGNVWLTRSVPPNTKVYYRAALTDRDGETDIIEFK